MRLYRVKFTRGGPCNLVGESNALGECTVLADNAGVAVLKAAARLQPDLGPLMTVNFNATLWESVRNA